MNAFDLIVRGGTIVNHAGGGGRRRRRRGQDRRHRRPLGASAGETVVDAPGLHVLPGVIDTQVHFREPGLEWKEDLETGSRAAALGGVTAVFEMPNTDPRTTTPDTLTDKLARANGRMHVDHAFYVGATHENAGRAGRDWSACRAAAASRCSWAPRPARCWWTTTRASSAWSATSAAAPPSIPRTSTACTSAQLARPGDWTRHPEVRDAETAICSTQRLVRPRAAPASASTCCTSRRRRDGVPGHRQGHRDVRDAPAPDLVGPKIYERLKGFAQMNPPIRDAHHQRRSVAPVNQGVADVIGSDHAPHTRRKKPGPIRHRPPACRACRRSCRSC